jgi:hypothetical protein
VIPFIVNVQVVPAVVLTADAADNSKVRLLSWVATVVKVDKLHPAVESWPETVGDAVSVNPLGAVHVVSVSIGSLSQKSTMIACMVVPEVVPMLKVTSYLTLVALGVELLISMLREVICAAEALL